MKVLFKLVRWLLVLLTITTLAGCKFFREEPVNLSVSYVEKILKMPADQWARRGAAMDLRERQAFDYLRALREQGRKLAVDVNKVNRPDDARREVLIVVNEVFGAAGEPRARLRFLVDRGAGNKWKIDRVELME
jgi:hypothetical protein